MRVIVKSRPDRVYKDGGAKLCMVRIGRGSSDDSNTPGDRDKRDSFAP